MRRDRVITARDLQRVKNETPARKRGHKFCGRKCGLGCTYAQFEVARRDAAALLLRLGDGWHASVHDNLGWHWTVFYGRDPLGISFSKPSGSSQYMLIVIANGMSTVKHGNDPYAMLRSARAAFESVAKRLTESALTIRLAEART